MTDRPLPEHLILTVGADRFFIFESSTMGDNDNTYLWLLDNDLGWSESDMHYATLAEALYQAVWNVGDKPDCLLKVQDHAPRESG